MYDSAGNASLGEGPSLETLSREQSLIRAANLVFCPTAGKCLQWRLINSNTHVRKIGIDWKFWARSTEKPCRVHRDLMYLPRPVLGYIGAVDERVDYALLAKLADADPSRSIVAIGPIQPNRQGVLPQRPNLHWLEPMNPDDRLAMVKGIDVAVFPFAKRRAHEADLAVGALQAIASGKPVVATTTIDSLLTHPDTPQFSADHESFLESCRQVAASKTSTIRLETIAQAKTYRWSQVVRLIDLRIARTISMTQNQRAPHAVPPCRKPLQTPART